MMVINFEWHQIIQAIRQSSFRTRDKKKKNEAWYYYTANAQKEEFACKYWAVFRIWNVVKKKKEIK